MALDVEVGTFTKDSTGTDGATDVVSTGFQPKAIIIWGVLQQTSDAEGDGDASHSLGFSDGVNHRCVDVRSEDNIARSDYLRAHNNDGVLGFLDPAGTGFLAKCSVVFNASDFTITWDLNNTDASRIHYIIYGGADITGVQVGDFVKTTAAAPVNQSIEGLDADVQNITAGEGIVFFLHARRNAFNITTNDIFTQLGAASDTTEEAVFAAGGDDNDAVGQPFLFNLDDACIIGTGTASGGINYEGEFNGFDALGFDINFRLNDGVTDIISFMIIKGGKWEVGTETAGTVTGNKVTTTEHRPKGLLVIGNKQTVTGFSRGIDQSYNIGASDATTESSGAWTDNDGSITMEVGRASSITKLSRIFNQDTAGAPTINGEANVDSFNATNFTLNWTNAAAVAYRFMWVIAGDGVVVPTERTLTHTTDSVLKKLDNEITHTTDSVLKAIDNLLTHTTDSVLKKLDNLLTHTTDSVLKTIDNLLTHDTDSVLKAIDNEITHTTDSLLYITRILAHTTDSVLKKLDNEINHTTDSVLKKLDNIVTHTTDSFLAKIVTLTHTTDSWLNVEEGLADHLLKEDGFHLLKEDGFRIILDKGALQKTITHTTDSVLKKLDTLITHTTDSILKKLDNTIIHTTDSILKKIDNLITHTTDSVLKKLDNTITHTTDSVLKKLDNIITHTTDSILKKLDNLVTHTTDSFLAVEGGPTVVTKTHTTDSVLKKLDNTITHTTDSFLKSIQTLTHTTDSVLKKLDNTVTHTTDSVLKKIDNLVTHDTDSVLKKLDNTLTHTTDSFLATGVTVVTLTHTTDSILKKLDNILTHTTDSFVGTPLILAPTAPGGQIFDDKRIEDIRKPQRVKVKMEFSFRVMSDLKQTQTSELLIKGGLIKEIKTILRIKGKLKIVKQVLTATAFHIKGTLSKKVTTKVKIAGQKDYKNLLSKLAKYRIILQEIEDEEE